MAPNAKGTDIIPHENEGNETKNDLAVAPRTNQIVYPAIIVLIYLHLAAVYGLWLCITSAKWMTILFCYIIYVLGHVGMIVGSHRLWSHKSFKAKPPLQILLMLFNCLAYQYTAIHWAKDHRLHHKYSDTDGDPQNPTRGMFFAHFGWMLVKKHPEVFKRAKLLDFSDLDNNPVLTFQKKYAAPLFITGSFLLPMLVPMYFWGESLSNMWHINLLRYVLNINTMLLINSVAHKWGYKPFDKTITSTDHEIIQGVTLGEGYHNYHHAFPWDYKSTEFGNSILNFTTMFIDFFAWVGWAYDLKTTQKDVIVQKANRIGDGSYIAYTDKQ